jgi:hypothetical protein
VGANQPFDKIECSCTPSVEVHGTEDGLKGVGEDRITISAPRGILAAAEEQVLAEFDRTRNRCQSGRIHDTLAEVGQIPLLEIRESVVGEVGNHPPKYRITEKLEPLI